MNRVSITTMHSILNIDSVLNRASPFKNGHHSLLIMSERTARERRSRTLERSHPERQRHRERAAVAVGCRGHTGNPAEKRIPVAQRCRWNRPEEADPK